MAAAAANKLLLIDGSGYIFRAFHALPPMSRPDGTPVNAVFGFTKMVLKLVDDLQPHSVAVIFDAGRHTFRNDIYPDYKANRSEPPEELVPQFALVREATKALSLPLIEMPGYEADDVIATYARLAREAGRDCLIVSSDKDLMQLVTEGVSMLDPMKSRPIGPDEVVEKFGVGPERVIDVQALAGDSTDNVPGVPGIGIKTAAQLINEFGDLDALLAGAGTIKQPKRRENLIEFADQARLSRQLVALTDQVDVPIEIAELTRPERDMDKLAQFLSEQGFKSLIASMGMAVSPAASGGDAGSVKSASSGADTDGPDAVQMPADVACHYQLVTTLDALQDWVEKATAQGFVALDTETDNLNAAHAELVGISLAIAPGQACYIPVRHGAAGDAADGGLLAAVENPDDTPSQLSLDAVMDVLRPMLQADNVLKIGHNLKYDAHVLKRAINGGIELVSVDDTMCLSFVLDAGRVDRHGLDYLALHWLGIETIKYETLCGKGAKQIPFSAVPLEQACDYAAEDADIALRLWMMLKPRLGLEGLATVYERLERPLIPVLAAMEAEGIQVDAAILHRLSNDFATRIDALEKHIHALAGTSFNVASPKQLGEILFDQMGLQGGKKSKTGAYSTGADVLEDLASQGVEIAQSVLDYRQLAKLKSTYTDALTASIHPQTKRVHTSFSMVGAATGRLSSSDPNLQNIPIRTAEGRSIRTAFIAPPGKKLISADYSQIELRLVAHVAGESSMLNAFQNGVDIHAQTASEVFQVPLADMDGETRRRAKAINFGIIYGISGFGLARQLAIPQAEARDYIAAYFERFPGIRRYMDEMKAQAKEQGYVETLFGRRLHIGGLKSSNPAMRGFAERQAINAPIQGSAADIIKRAMVRLPEALGAAGLSATMLLQVHDELIFEVQDDEAEAAVQLITSIMETAHQPALTLDVPLIAEAGIAESWSDAH